MVCDAISHGKAEKAQTQGPLHSSFTDCSRDVIPPRPGGAMRRDSRNSRQEINLDPVGVEPLKYSSVSPNIPLKG